MRIANFAGIVDGFFSARARPFQVEFRSEFVRIATRTCMMGL